MRIGIITFHWVTNYGAVLQAWALQEYLRQLGHDAELIDYYPPELKTTLKKSIRTKKISVLLKNLNALHKERKFELFRQKRLLCGRHYSTHTQLKQSPPEYDCYICGSDQIWHYNFVDYRQGSSVNNFSYFLDFAPEEKKKVSYAASFGVDTYKEELIEGLKKNLDRFDAISLREQTGVTLVKQLGYEEAVLVPDPTLLLMQEHYNVLLDAPMKKKQAFVYVLHHQERSVEACIADAKAAGLKIVKPGACDIEAWLSGIRDSELVITNSFHGVVFSILFKVPFAAVLIDGSQMNDRLITLLTVLGLESRICQPGQCVENLEIDWNAVDEKLKAYRQIGYDFLQDLLQ